MNFTRRILLLISTVIATSSTAAVAREPFRLFPDCPLSIRSSESETEDEIETDRDSFTPSTGVVGRGRLVLESAYSFIDNREVPETHSLPELVVRYGIGENIELRFGYNYEVGGAGNPISGNIPDDTEDSSELEREANILFGTKVWLTEQDNFLPRSSMIVQGFTPVRGESTDTQLSATYVFGWQLNSHWQWDSAIRYGTGSFEEDRFSTWSPSTVIKIPIGESWKVHAEYFSVATAGRATDSTQHFFSPGAHYLITPNLEIGLRVGWGLNEQAPNFFSNVGGGIRF
jgi:hypothetical protein